MVHLRKLCSTIFFILRYLPNGWNNLAIQLYGVQAIPYNFIIDPEGKIIGKNLPGKDLTDKLAILDKPTQNFPVKSLPEPKF